MIPLGGYAGGGNLELGAAAGGILTGVLGVVCWWACTYFGYWIGEMAGYPVTGTMMGFLGIPILAILVNGWDDGRGEVK